jgi:hypothetical protein
MKLIPIVALLWASVAYGVTGDLNKDGTVDFDDFFLFADNFGKSGLLSYLDVRKFGSPQPHRQVKFRKPCK